jgi:hypothetical protein
VSVAGDSWVGSPAGVFELGVPAVAGRPEAILQADAINTKSEMMQKMCFFIPLSPLRTKYLSENYRITEMRTPD